MMDRLSNAPDDPQPDWARLLPREAFHEIILILRVGCRGRTSLAP